MKSNKKLISVLLSLCLLLSLTPIISFADSRNGTAKTEPNKNGDGAYIITNAEELAWFADDAESGSEKCAVLTADIDLGGTEWTPIGSASSAAYSGTFNGNGHTVSGLKVSGTGNYLGFFGYIGTSGKVSNLTIIGEVTYSGSSSSSYAGGVTAYSKGTIESCISDVCVTGKSGTTGGVAGYNEGTITGCVNKNNIISSTTSYSTGGIAGACSGGTITLCANYGNIENTNSRGYNSGGIAGKTQGSTVITDVYNTGKITSYNYTGGIVGQLYGFTSMNNAYSTGIISCGATGNYAYSGGIASYGYGTASTILKKMSNCYFLISATVNSGLSALQGNNSDTVCGKSEDELKSSDFIAILGGTFDMDTANINNGYPILKWQNPSASYKAVITVTPANAAVILANSNEYEITGTADNGVYTFDNLSKGAYTYTVSCAFDDYKSESGNFTISNSDYYNSVTLPQNTYTVSFTAEPAYADFTLKEGDTILTPDTAEGGSYEYTLPNGSYEYSASAFGFKAETGSIAVNKTTVEKSVMLERLPSAKTAFLLTDKTNSTALDSFRTEVKSEDYVINEEIDSSYLLPAGTYTYKVMCPGYVKCIGGFEITQNDIDTGTRTISLETEPSSAWDGGLDEPVYRDGAWQISTGNELAWFAGYVNGTQTTETNGVTYNACLLNDIDLGGDLNWTPIGPNSYKAYSGIFDGNGHTVSGLYIDTDSVCQGLFGKITLSAVIKNLTVAGNVKTESTSSYAYAGGICGYNYKGEISNCVNRVNVTSNGGRTGGICGASEGDGSTPAKISRCANYGAISYESGTGQYKGGITGESRYTTISECANGGTVIGNGNYVGGIAGDLYSGSSLTDSYNTGTVTAKGYSIGGIAGRTYLYGNYGMINCYSVGEVKNTLNTPQNYGALIGLYSGGLNTNCYCLIEDGGINSGLSAIGKTDSGTPAEVNVKSSANKIKAAVDELNLNCVWTINNELNGGLPILLWQDTVEELPERAFRVDGNQLSENDMIIPSGKHRIEANYSLIGKDTDSGVLVIAIYEKDGTLIQISESDSRYITSVNCDIPQNGSVKIMFWDKNIVPLAKPTDIKAE